MEINEILNTRNHQISFKETIEKLRKILENYIIESNLKSLVIGISGGIDSAFVAAIAKPVVNKLNIPLIGRSITIESNSLEEQERAKQIGNLFCTDFKEINLTEQYSIMKNFDDIEDEINVGSDNPILVEMRFNRKFNIKYKIRMGNIKARMRMMYLYNLASKTSGLVLSTDNNTELLLGFSTLHGDVGDLGLIQYLWKTEVYDMTEWLALNSTEKEEIALMSCVECDATDGLGISNTDLDQILPDWKNKHTSTRSGYNEVDNILKDYINIKTTVLNCDIIDEILSFSVKLIKINKHPVIIRHKNSEFKRNNPHNINREDYIIN